MKLYSYYRSSTSYRIRIALNLKVLNYSYIPVNLKNGDQRGNEFRDANPHGTVPVLVDGEQTLTQSLAIIDWLEEQYPALPFQPERPRSRQVCKELYYAIATEVHAPNNLPVLDYLRSTFSASQEQLEQWNQIWIRRTFAPVEKRLSEWDWSHPLLPFGAPGLFEIVLIPQIYNAVRWKTDLTDFPQLMRINDHCLTLDAFAIAHPDRQPDAVETQL